MTESSALAPRPDGAPTITVVIPALNEGPLLARCLRALDAQKDKADEIIVVDNGSEDDTVRIAQDFDGVRVLEETRRGITYARQAGFDAAQGDVIARIDADSLVRSDWIAQIRSDFTKGDVDAQGGGAAIAELSPNGAYWFSWWYRGFRLWHERSIGVHPMLYGFNCALRRDAWLKARPLVVMDDQRVSEDVDVTIALLRTGHRLRFAPKMIVKARLFRSLDREKLARYYATDSLTLARHHYGNPRRWARAGDLAPTPDGAS